MFPGYFTCKKLIVMLDDLQLVVHNFTPIIAASTNNVGNILQYRKLSSSFRLYSNNWISENIATSIIILTSNVRVTFSQKIISSTDSYWPR